ncbi:MAG: 2-oxoacid:acceptor oxidoreductase subunit alpha, partial [bacterium]|nr:2-oxoacid:acceptor oxidoreductase subunit alpha [bacterium]
REKLVIPEEGEIPLVERLRTGVKEGVNYHPYLPREDGRLPMSDFGDVHRYNVTGLYHDMWGFPTDKPGLVQELLRHQINKIENNVHKMTFYKSYFLEDAQAVLISYGSSARAALSVVKQRRNRGENIGLLELNTIWPFPATLVRECTENAGLIGVVEMNVGQLTQAVKLAVAKPKKVHLINRVDGQMITDTDIKKTLRVLQGRGI